MKSIKILVAAFATFVCENVFGQTITASDVNIVAGGTAELTFTINSESKAALAELVMTLPEGIKVKFDADEDDYVYELGSDMTVKTHSATVAQRDNGDWYVLVSNSSGKEFKAASGDYITLTLEASGTATSGTATLKDILLVDLAAKAMNTVTEGSFKVTVGSADGINGITLDDPNAEVYTLSGQRIDGKSAKKGVYVVNGKKVAVK